MALTLADVKNPIDTPLPPIIVLYGVEKIGKSTFASAMESPIFLPFEDGVNNISTSAFPLLKSWNDFIEATTALATEPHQYKTLVIDTIDALEPIIWDKVCTDSNAKSIEKVGGGYGKGYAEALEDWRIYHDTLEYFRRVHGMTILQLAHSKVKEVKLPDQEIFDKYNLKLQDGKNTSAAAFIFERADMILFANYQTNLLKEKTANDETRARAIGNGQRYLFTEERPAFKAGNRYGLPDKIEFDKAGVCWQTIKKSIPYFNQPKGN